MKKEITIRDLHHNTGELVRAAGKERTPVPVTDRGKVVAVLGSPKLIKTNGSNAACRRSIRIL